MKTWISDILIASIFVSASYITVKYAVIKSGNNNGLLERSFIILSLTMGILAILTLLFFKETRNNIIKDIKNIESSKWILLSGLCIFISYFFLFRGSVSAPNLGYARSILTIDIIMLTIFSALLFNAPISLTSILGMIFIILGILLVSLYN
jgi:drug/metabolite transporter (DMT)-like permease